MVEDLVVREWREAKEMLAALSGLSESETPLEHGRAIAERLSVSAAVVRAANSIMVCGGDA